MRKSFIKEPGRRQGLNHSRTRLAIASRTLPNVSADGLFNMDVSLSTFRVKERYSLYLRGEAFNMTNTPTFAAPGSSSP